MATNYGVYATYRLNQEPTEFINAEAHAKLMVLYDTFELTADLSAADTIEMCDLIPSGAIVHEVVLATDDLDASGGTLDVGWKASDDAVESADTDGFIDGADITSADCFEMSDNQAGPVNGMLKTFSAAVQPIVTVATDTDATSGTVRLAIYYSLK